MEPKFLGPNLEDIIRVQLYRQVEGTCSGRHGYIVAIVSMDDVGKGTVHDSYGYVSFNVRYTAIVLKPFKNEVMDATVDNANKMGFFANVGPLTVFVSNHHIPGDFKFEPTANPPCYISEEQGVRIANGSLVRLKIHGTRVDATEIVIAPHFILLNNFFSLPLERSKRIT